MSVKPQRFRQDPLGRLRWHAGAVKAYIEGTPQLRRLMRRQLLLAALERHVTPLVAIETDGIRYLIDTADRGPITLRIFAEGSYDAPLMRRVMGLLSDVLGRSDPLAGREFIDVGANIGTATLAAIKHYGAARVLALEPDPANFRLLRMNLIANDVEPAVVALQTAVSDEETEVELERATHNIGDHRIRTGAEVGPGAIGEAWRDVIRVSATTLDAVTAHSGFGTDDLGLVWIDVQGHEAQVLRGASTLIYAGVPVLIEYWPYGLTRAGALDALHEIIGDRFGEVWNVGEESVEGPPVKLAPSDVSGLSGLYPTEDDSTNLLLLPT